MLDSGWALSAEIGGVAARDLAGPHLQPSVAWVRGRREAALMMLGGRNLDGSASTQLSLSNGNQVIDSWTIAPGFFFRLDSASGRRDRRPGVCRRRVARVERRAIASACRWSSSTCRRTGWQ